MVPCCGGIHELAPIEMGITTMRWLCMMYVGLFVLVALYASMGVADAFVMFERIV